MSLHWFHCGILSDYFHGIRSKYAKALDLWVNKAHIFHFIYHSRRNWQQSAALAIDMHFTHQNFNEHKKIHTKLFVLSLKRSILRYLFTSSTLDMQILGWERRVNVDRDL